MKNTIDSGLLDRVRKQVHRLEVLLNTEIPGTPRISQVRRAAGADGKVGFQGRVMYVALPGTGSKSQNVLSPRAKQVLGQINRHRRATAAMLQEALEVNRNVIAGAVHELKKAGLVAAETVGGGANDSWRPTQVAAGQRPRKAGKTRK